MVTLSSKTAFLTLILILGASSNAKLDISSIHFAGNPAPECQFWHHCRFWCLQFAPPRGYRRLFPQCFDGRCECWPWTSSHVVAVAHLSIKKRSIIMNYPYKLPWIECPIKNNYLSTKLLMDTICKLLTKLKCKLLWHVYKTTTELFLNFCSWGVLERVIMTFVMVQYISRIG